MASVYTNSKNAIAVLAGCHRTLPAPDAETGSGAGYLEDKCLWRLEIGPPDSQIDSIAARNTADSLLKKQPNSSDCKKSRFFRKL
jgi:hypothetical protein